MKRHTSSVTSRVRSAWLARLFLALSLSALLLCWSLPRPVRAGAQQTASSGDLDPDFGDGGKVVTDFSGFSYQDEARSLITQADGKIVAAGTAWGWAPTSGYEPSVTADANFALARYNPNGSIDYPFGGMQQGRVQIDFHGRDDYAYASALLPNGKIVAGGVVTELLMPTMDTPSVMLSRKSFGLTQLNADGTLDTSFGVSGMAVDGFGSESGIHALAVEPLDMGPTALNYNKIWAGGYSKSEKLGRDFTIARYFNGQLLGHLETDFWGLDDEINALAIGSVEVTTDSVAPTGLSYRKIWAAGYATQPLEAGMKTAFALVRYNVDGTRDMAFGTNGRVSTSFDGDAIARAIAVQSDGKAVVAGVVYYPDAPPGGEFKSGVLVRYNADGSLDSSFGSGGVLVVHFKGGASELYAIGLMPDGKIVVAGAAEDTQRAGFVFALAAFNGDGSIDKSFGSKGQTRTDFSGVAGASDEACAAAFTSDHRVIAGGMMANNTFHSDFALACYKAASGFDLSAPDVVLGQRGTTVKVNVSVMSFGGFSDEVTITAPNLSDIGVKVKPGYAVPVLEGQTFKFKIKAGAVLGSHTVTFSGDSSKGNGLTRTIILSIGE